MVLPKEISDHCTHFGRHEQNAPKVSRKGSLHNQQKVNSGRLISVRTETNINRVRDLYAENPRMSITRGAQALNMAMSTVRKKTLSGTLIRFRKYSIFHLHRENEGLFSLIISLVV